MGSLASLEVKAQQTPIMNAFDVYFVKQKKTNFPMREEIIHSSSFYSTEMCHFVGVLGN